jgi:hypothetical protein
MDPTAGLGDFEKRKFLTLPGVELRPLSIQLVASRYTDYATPALKKIRLVKKSTVIRVTGRGGP